MNKGYFLYCYEVSSISNDGTRYQIQSGFIEASEATIKEKMDAFKPGKNIELNVWKVAILESHKIRG